MTLIDLLHNFHPIIQFFVLIALTYMITAPFRVWTAYAGRIRVENNTYLVEAEPVVVNEVKINDTV